MAANGSLYYHRQNRKKSKQTYLQAEHVHIPVVIGLATPTGCGRVVNGSRYQGTFSSASFFIV